MAKIGTYLDELETLLAKRDPLEPAVIVVPSPQIAYCVKRHFARKNPSALFNVRLVTPQVLVQQLLEQAGVPYEMQDSLARICSLGALFSQGLPQNLKYFRHDLLSLGTGFAAGFSKTIAELDMAGLTPATLAKASADHRTADIAAIWKELEANGGKTPGRISQGTAIRRLEQMLKDGKCPAPGSVFWVKNPAQPPLYGRLAAALGAKTAALFDGNYDEIMDCQKITKATFEGWESAEEELEATRHWILNQLRSGIPAQDIAVITPAGAEYVTAKYLSAALPERNIVLLYGGENALTHEGGARIRQVLDAIAENLSYETMIEVLPHLDIGDDTRESEGSGSPAEGIPKKRYTPKSRGSWIGVVNCTGTLGGGPGNKEGIHDWGDYLAKKCPETAPYRKPLDLLIACCKAVQEGKSLEEIWEPLSDLVGGYCIMPGADERIKLAFVSLVESVLGQEAVSSAKGGEALEILGELLACISLPDSRYGEPRVFVGNLGQAAGIEFKAVRFTGLNEGVLPSAPSEDAVRGDRLHDAIAKSPGGCMLFGAKDRLAQERDRLLSVLAFVPQVLSLSHAIQSADSRDRAPSSIYLDFLLRLKPSVKDLKLNKALSGVLLATRKTIQTDMESLPLGGRGVSRFVRGKAGGKTQPVPLNWDSREGFGVTRLVRQHRAYNDEKDAANPYDGLAGAPGIDKTKIPGFTEENRLHPSSAGGMLLCPRRYLWDRVLGWGCTGEPYKRGMLDQMLRGTMFHWIVQKLYEGSGIEGLKKMAPAQRGAHIRKTAEKAFEEFPASRFIASEHAKKTAIDTLQRGIEWVVDSDIAAGVTGTQQEKRFLAKIKAGAGWLHIDSTIDRIEYRGGKCFRIVDFKTGSGKNRDRGGNPFLPQYDMQVVLYLLAAAASGYDENDAEALEFRYPENNVLASRTFEGEDLKQLRAKAKKWLAFIHEASQKGFFPGPLNLDACRWCDFLDVCDIWQGANGDKIRSSSDPAAKLFAEIWDDILETGKEEKDE